MPRRSAAAPASSASAPAAPVLPALPPPDRALALLEALLLPRAIEERMLRLIRQGRVSKWFSGYGQEAIAVGVAWALGERDWLLPMHRNHGLWTTRGVPLDPLFAQLMGKTGGYTAGRDRTYHFGLPEKRIVGMISHLGAMWPVACGLGLAAQLQALAAAGDVSDGSAGGTASPLRPSDTSPASRGGQAAASSGSLRQEGVPFVACALLGEGATREGDVHEALSLASVWRLPVVFVVENNGYGLSTPTRDAVPVEDIADAAAGYGMPGVIVDGNDILAVIAAVTEAAGRARRGEGPTLLEMKTFRMRGHEEASGTKYVPDDLFAEWAPRDPVARYVARLVGAGLVTDADVATLRARLDADVTAAAERALALDEPESTVEIETNAVFAPSPTPPPTPADAPRREMRFIDAITDALDTALENDDRVVLMGQDIAGYGGVFKATQGLSDRHGAHRVRNTPIIESGAIGAAMGLALEGYRPVVEIQYADFIACGVNQIVNNLGTTHYRWGAALPVTIRAPFGGGIGAGPFHSQAMEAWFAHAPGLKIAIPSTPEDARGLLLAAIDDPNPVLVFEHKALYRSLKGLVPTDADARTPLGVARTARAGRDLTIVTYGVGVIWAMAAAERWAARGVEIEVVDLRTLVPWDRAAVVESVARTNRLVALHEAWRTAGMGAEIAAEIAEVAFAHLDAPPARVGGLDTPIPFSRHIEGPVFSAESRLDAAIERTLAY